MDSDNDKYKWPNGSGYFQKSNPKALVRSIKKGAEVLGFPDLKAEERRRKTKILLDYAKTLDW
jgi:hypothetical protein